MFASPRPVLAILTLILAASCSHHATYSGKARQPAIPERNQPTASQSARYGHQALILTNSFRRQHGLAPLQRDRALDRAAQRHSAVMAKHRYLGHHEPGGTNSILKRVRKAGYKAKLAAENVFGPSLQAPVIDHAILEPSHAVNGWTKSPGHRKNLLNPRAVHVGFGYVNGYWTQVLAAPLPTFEETLPAKAPRTTPLEKPGPKPFGWRDL